MPHISFRFATKSDNQKIYDFAMRAISGTQLPRFAEDAGENLLDRIEKGKEKSVILAEDHNLDESVIGYIEVDPDRTIEGSAVYLRGIYVLPEYRRGGIGKRLLQMMVKEKRKSGEELKVRAFTEEGL
ncbi:MAG: GNAT family N-acetyltransferase, partial [Candidatus Kariarchaeaceae archaeon]